MHSDKQNTGIILPSGCLRNSDEEKELKLLSNIDLC